MLRISRISKYSLIGSGILLVASIIILIVWGLRLGIEFRGGALTELRFAEPVTVNELRLLLKESGFGEPIVQPTSGNQLIIKTRPLSPEEQNKLSDLLEENRGSFEELRFESVGPIIGKELLRKAYWQVALVIIGILLYIGYAFRRIKKVSHSSKLSSWRLSLATIIALVHDLMITIGVFVILGQLKAVEIDSLFVTALLTILGFSVHDTIVVFDRVREYLERYPYKSLDEIIDFATASTLARSINTSSTLLFVLLALLLFGGQTIFYFVLALLVGVVTGTYSSIFIANPLLLYFKFDK